MRLRCLQIKCSLHDVSWSSPLQRKVGVGIIGEWNASHCRQKNGARSQHFQFLKISNCYRKSSGKLVAGKEDWPWVLCPTIPLSKPLGIELQLFVVCSSRCMSNKKTFILDTSLFACAAQMHGSKSNTRTNMEDSRMISHLVCRYLLQFWSISHEVLTFIVMKCMMKPFYY